MMKSALPAILWPDSRILILGSLPGEESLRRQQYYGHPKNQFWDILGRIYLKSISADYDGRLEFLQEHGIALWDVIGHAERQGSLDSNIRNEVPNDFATLFGSAPNLHTIALNGAKAATSFERYVRRRFEPQLTCVRLVALPSTSPVPSRKFLTADQKAEKWRAIMLD